MDFINSVAFTPSWNLYPFKYTTYGVDQISQFVAGVANDKFICLGGTSGNATLLGMYTYDLKTHVGALSHPSGHFVSSGGGRGYKNRYIIYAGGISATEMGTAKTEQYDAVTQTFSRLSSMPESQIGASGAITTDRMYYMGGFNFEHEHDVPAHRTFYINTNTWGRLVWFPQEYKYQAMAGDPSQDRMVIVAGADTWLFDGNARQWSQKANCPWPFFSGAGIIYEGIAYFVGEHQPAMMAFDIAANTWRLEHNLSPDENVNYGAMDLWGTTIVATGNAIDSRNIYEFNKYKPEVNTAKLQSLQNLIALTPRRELQI